MSSVNILRSLADVEGGRMATWRIGTTIRTVLEWDHWAGEADVDLRDTMQPLIDRGLVDFVATDHHVCDGVRLEAAPGHAPGQVAVAVESGTGSAVITGDLVQHPVRFIEPDVAGLAGTGTLVTGTHFPAPTAGLLRRGGDGAVRFVADGLR
ncbi:MBL fold metallo-hydrolase [Streptomyces sp. NPDC049949]|uniref:MBL fold metallo-hydrolase n=1 Tax=Streptomyces sp. NPDC049949 TaxID=3154627 RepID=UPI00342DEAD4